LKAVLLLKDKRQKTKDKRQKTKDKRHLTKDKTHLTKDKRQKTKPFIIETCKERDLCQEKASQVISLLRKSFSLINKGFFP
jgi:hypothetical protein